MKYIVIVAFIIFAGCSVDIGQKNLKAAEESCKAHGGVFKIRVMQNVPDWVTCKNSNSFKLPQ